jgi:hypothetical protein
MISDFLKTINLKDLENKGFILLKNCIKESDINLMKTAYLNAPVSSNNNYNYIRKSKLCKDLGNDIFNLITDAMRIISNETNINCDTLLEGYYWPTGKNGVLFPWHQDHEPYYMNELNYNYLNFYIIVEKEQIENANLALVPFNSLSNDLVKLLEKRGGTIYGSGKNIKERTLSLCEKYNTESFGSIGINKMDSYDFVIRDSMTGLIAPLPINFEDIKEIPQLQVGDMLIMRGDLIHRTQNNLCNRLALSLRCVKKSECVINLKNLTTLSLKNTENLRILPITIHKAKVMLMNEQWIWMLSILSVYNNTLNFADYPDIWEYSDWSILSNFQKIKCLTYFIYYKILLKYLYLGNGTLFWWNDIII